MGPGENEPREPNTGVADADEREPNTIDLANADANEDEGSSSFREPNTEN